MSKIVMTASFGAGYVLGARAGRERFEQISERASQLWGHPVVQEQTSKATSFVQQKVPGLAPSHTSSSGLSGGAHAAATVGAPASGSASAPATAEEIVLHDGDPLVYSTGPSATATAEEIAEVALDR